jgi:ferredoxin-type protein NapH
MMPIQIEPFKVYTESPKLEWTKKAGLGIFLVGVFFLLVSLTGTAMIMPNLFLFLSFGLSIIGAVIYSLSIIWEAPAGIKNNNIFSNRFTSRGVSAWISGIIITAFYFFLYWFPSFIENWIRLVDPISFFLRDEKADRWFLYGTFYTLAVLFMGLKMIIKYRHSRYHIIRTISVMFFQLAFAYLIPSLLIMFNKPEHYFSYFWPLKYDYLFPVSIHYLTQTAGALGYFMVFWGIAMTFIAVPVLSYFFGKRWYCSWVCGCGGLAETAGDPFRHLSDKSLKAWKIERWSIHSVLVFIVVTTTLLWINSAAGGKTLGSLSQTFSSVYGFLIGAVFSGIVGVGFYPIMGSRVWCRFGCPLAATLGIFQRFKSKFRITTNGGQCISCGNCSTYCEMGIDVRAYAQRKQNIIRSSCVGCGVCAAVCPRGVLRLENGPEEGRYNLVLDDQLMDLNH